jgi:hypothetical protein
MDCRGQGGRPLKACDHVRWFMGGSGIVGVERARTKGLVEGRVRVVCIEPQGISQANSLVIIRICYRIG